MLMGRSGVEGVYQIVYLTITTRQKNNHKSEKSIKLKLTEVRKERERERDSSKGVIKMPHARIIVSRDNRRR